MPGKKTAPQTKVPKSPKSVPEWAKKVKVYREEAGKTQVEIQNAIHAKVNTVSLVERGIREFTASERKLFFEFIGKAEDPSVPCKARERKPKVPTKAAKPAKTKPKKVGKPAKRTKASNPGQEPMPQPVPVALPGPGVKRMTPLPASSKKAKAAASQKSPSLRRGRKPSMAPTSIAAPKVVGKNATDSAPKNPGKTKTQQPVIASPVKPPPAKLKPTKEAEPAPILNNSPVKEAVLRDISRILSNPGLSDNHAKRLHNLFTSLAVNALLGE